MTPDVEIIIVTYNSAGHIASCLRAARGHCAGIVVIDNASTDFTVREVTQVGVRLIANPRNLGFAAAVNQGFQCTTAPYLLVLNPDAQIETGLGPLRDACAQPGIAGAGGMLRGSDGLPQIGFMVRSLPKPVDFILETLVLNRICPANRANRRYRCLDRNYSEPFPAEQPAGAFLMIRRDVWEKLGGFDEQYYPLWFEDVDFCKRAVDLGLHFQFVPAAVAKHTGGHSIPTLAVELRPFYWYRSLLRYTAKHFSPASVRAVCSAVILGSLVRMVVETIVRRSRAPLVGYGSVVRLAGRRWLCPEARTE